MLDIYSLKLFTRNNKGGLREAFARVCALREALLLRLLEKEDAMVASSSLLLDLEFLSTSSDETGSSGGHQTSLLTAGSVSGDGRGVTDVLLVTTTMRMVNGVHGNTSNSGPGASSLCLPSVV